MRESRSRHAFEQDRADLEIDVEMMILEHGGAEEDFVAGNKGRLRLHDLTVEWNLNSVELLNHGLPPQQGKKEIRIGT